MTSYKRDTEELDEEDKNGFLQFNPMKPASQETQNMDDFFVKLGDPGKLQIIWFFLLACCLFSVAPNAVVGVFFSYSPAHVCNATADWSDLSEPLNAAESDHVTYRNPRPTPSAESTSDTGGSEVNNLTAQANWTVMPLSYSNPTQLFDLVCDRRFLTDLASTLYYLGLMLANMTLGYASDVLGRRPVILLTLHLILLTGLGIAFANSYLMFALLRILMGLLCQGLQSASFVMSIELFPVHHRGRAGSITQVFWGLGCLYLSAVAWLAQDWRIIQLSMLIPTAVSALALWYVGESLRWMLAKGKTQRASKAVARISTFNKVTNPISVDDHCVLAEYKVHCEKHRSSYLALVRTPQMFRRTISLSIVLFGVNVGYFGMTYNNAELAGDRHLNFFLGSITETIAYMLGVFVVVRFGRKRSLITCLMLGSACCLISGVISRTGGVNDKFIVIFSILGRFAMAACFCASDTYTAELFPTIVRNMGVGVCTLVGRFGSALAPQISALRHVAFPQLPPLIFAAFAFTGAMLILLLPETIGQRLPDTIEDVEGKTVHWDANSNLPNLKAQSNQEVKL